MWWGTTYRVYDLSRKMSSQGCLYVSGQAVTFLTGISDAAQDLAGYGRCAGPLAASWLAG